MDQRREKIIILTLFLVFLTIPFVVAAFSGGDLFHFEGFLFNPIDGNSYFAKMYQGWQGEWSFRLPFDPNPGEGAYLFLFYIFLGHVARWTHLSIVLTFHLARLASSVALFFALAAWVKRILPDNWAIQRYTLLLVCFGSGTGWVASLFGLFTSDLWIAEAFPFLSCFANPHFPLSLAIILSVFLISSEPATPRNVGLLILLGGLCSVILPFGVVLILVVLGVKEVFTWIEERKINLIPVFSILILGGSFLIYQYWVTLNHPALSRWNQQNLTPAPPLWDFLISFAPAILLAGFGVFSIWRDHNQPERRLLISWFAAGLILVYVPFYLQRRFMLGFFIPTDSLAIIGLIYWVKKSFRKFKLWFRPLFIFSVLTNVFLLLSFFFGIQSHSQKLFLSSDEYSALTWLEANTPSDSLVLSSTEMGLYIPAITGRRVLYGHPFETLDAKTAEKNVNDFFSGNLAVNDEEKILAENKVNYIFSGPRETASGIFTSATLGLETVFQNKTVTIFATKKN